MRVNRDLVLGDAWKGLEGKLKKSFRGKLSQKIVSQAPFDRLKPSKVYDRSIIKQISEFDSEEPLKTETQSQLKLQTLKLPLTKTASNSISPF
jgi:hypothetical protein